jgi:hypothetical protein
MKTKLLTLLAFLLAVSAAAPGVSAQEAVLDSWQSRILRPTGPLKAAKAAAAVLRSSETTNLTYQEEGWINETRTRNEFQGGLLRRHYEDTWSGGLSGEWEDAEYTEYTYHNDGTLADETFNARGESGWIGIARTVYTAQNGVYTQIVDQENENGSWVDRERTTFTLSGGLYAVASLTETWDGGWVPAERFTLTEENGDVVETSQTYEGAAWVNEGRFTYTGHTIAELYVFLQQFVNDFMDYQGLYFAFRIPDALEQQWEGGSWVNVARQTTEAHYHPSEGFLEQEVVTSEEWAVESWVSGFRIVVDYATPTPTSPELEGLPAQTSFQAYDGMEWTDLLVEKYILQNDIRRIVQATIEADFGEGMTEIAQVRINWIDIGSVGNEASDQPFRFELDQNAPNPFNPGTRITYRLSAPQYVRLVVYDMLGREVATLEDGQRTAGEHAVSWEAGAMPSGIYLYRLQAGAQSWTRQMVLLK